MRALLLLPFLFALPACKKKRPNDDTSKATEASEARPTFDFGKAIAELSEFRTMMCACKANDKACADKVHEKLAAWSLAMTDTIKSAPKPSDAEMKQASDVTQQYSNCMSTAYGGAPTPMTPPPPTEKLTNADQILKRAYDDVPAGHVVAELRFSYVGADGTVDPTHGSAQVRLGKEKKPPPADDPSRRIGAPVPVDPSDSEMKGNCPTYTWKQGVRSVSTVFCHSSGPGITKPKCSVVEVWKRAIDAGAPETGLAVLTLNGTGPGIPKQYWSFAIDDVPRNIHFSHSVPDLCDPTLEKP